MDTPPVAQACCDGLRELEQILLAEHKLCEQEFIAAQGDTRLMRRATCWGQIGRVQGLIEFIETNKRIKADLPFKIDADESAQRTGAHHQDESMPIDGLFYAQAFMAQEHEAKSELVMVSNALLPQQWRWQARQVLQILSGRLSHLAEDERSRAGVQARRQIEDLQSARRNRRLAQRSPS